MKKISAFLLLITILYAQKPILSIEVNGTTKDMVLKKNKLIIGTDNGTLKEYDYQEKKFTKTIHLPKIKDFMGDLIYPRVFSVDKIEKHYLLLSESGEGGYSNLWMVKENKKEQIVFAKDKKAIIKARFINDQQILLAFLSNEVALFNIKSKQEIYRVQLSESKFSDFALNEDRTKAVFSCESGILNVIETKTGKTIHELKGVNLDNVYKVAFQNNIITGAGQDRKGSIYNLKNSKNDYIQGSFLIYATAISPSTNSVAFAMDEQNNISIYNRQTKSKIAELKGQKSTLNTIIFKDENILFSASEDNTILMWDLTKN